MVVVPERSREKIHHGNTEARFAGLDALACGPALRAGLPFLFRSARAESIKLRASVRRFKRQQRRGR
jgi:hypothetical protein